MLYSFRPTVLSRLVTRLAGHSHPQSIQSMLTLSEGYNKSVQEEMTMTQEQLKTRHVGKQDPKRHLENAVEQAMGDQVSLLELFSPFLSCFTLRHFRTSSRLLHSPSPPTVAGYL